MDAGTPRRLLLLSPSAAPGGAERLLVALARMLPDHGFAPPRVVLLEHGPAESWLRDAGVTVDVVAAPRTRYLPMAALVVARLRRLCEEGGVDAVVSSQSKGHVYGGLAAAWARRPEVWWQHGIFHTGVWDRLGARIPSALVVCGSDEALGAQRRHTPRLPAEKVTPGVPVAAIAARAGSGAAVRRDLGWDRNRVVGIVGRLQEWKGQRVFLDAAAAAGEGRPDVRFLVVGGAVLGSEGDYPAELRAQAARLGLGDRVHFAGHQDDVYPWFDACDVVVHASYREPFGLVLVEAMALGKPLVAAALAGPLDVVEDGRSGLLVPVKRPDLLADALGRVLDEPGLAAALAGGARARAAAFSEEQMVARWAGLLDRVLRGE